VRIHLDKVAGLGAFLEVEAVAAHSSDLATERALVEHLRLTFGITPDRLVATGYADLMLTCRDRGNQTAGKSDTQAVLP